MLTTYWRNTVLSDIYLDDQRTFYVGLSSTKPNAAGGNVTEPRGGNYARMPVAFGTPVDGRIQNTNNVTFPTSTDTWFTDGAKAAFYVIFDEATANAHVLGAGALYAPMAVGENVSLTIAAGLLSISLTDEDSLVEASGT